MYSMWIYYVLEMWCVNAELADQVPASPVKIPALFE